jgi:hypothetical protein
MSAAGALKDMVEAVVKTITDALHAKDDEQDKEIAALKERVTALESGTGQSAAQKATSARAGTAGAKASASRTTK